MCPRLIAQVTNVLGGFSYPTVNREGDLLTRPIPGGTLYQYPRPAVLADGTPQYVRTESRTPRFAPVLASAEAGASTFDWEALRGYDDTNVPALESRPYKSTFTSLYVVPVIRVDNYNPKSKGTDVIKAGAYVFSNDVLDKTGFFAGATLNAKLERDLFLQFTYRGRLLVLRSARSRSLRWKCIISREDR
jgi:hypothetical protein